GQAGNHREHLRRQARLVEHVGQEKRGERRQLGGLAHHAVVGGGGRRHLVGHYVQRVVERSDGRDGGQRIAQGGDAPLLAVRRQVAGEDLAVVDDAELAGEAEHVERAAHLVQRVLLRDAEFGGDQVGNLVLAAGEDLGGPDQDLLALVAGELRPVGGSDV